MKNLINIFVLAMFTLIGYSQEPENQEPAIQLEDVVIRSLNPEYLILVQDDLTPPEVAKLQLRAANYDVQQHHQFSEDVDTDTFEMAFKNSKGSIHAFYDNQGKIESAFERFRNVVLPRNILVEILETHKDWDLVGNLYVSSYEKENDNLIRSYKIDLQRGLDRKTVKIDPRK